MAVAVKGNFYDLTIKNATVNAAAVAYSAVGAAEIGIVVGNNVPAHKRKAITYELLRLVSMLRVKRPATLPTGGQVGVYALTLSGTSEPRAGAVAYSNVAAASAISENQVAIVVGVSAAASMDRTLLVAEGVRNCLERYWRDVARKA